MKKILLANLLSALILISGPGMWDQAGAADRSEAGAGFPHYYTVQGGDCLWSVAREFKVDVKTLAAANGLNVDSGLQKDESLLIPVGKYATSVSGFNCWPVSGRISSTFGPRHGQMHEGLDIAADEGKPVRAVKGGRVVFAGNRGTYGKAVIINHGRGVRSLYAHSSELEVAPGEYVEQGQIVARVGSTGHSTGPHLHLEILYRGDPLNPQDYLPGGSAE